MDITSIDSGKAVHTIWRYDTTGNFDIMNKRDGADYDPTTIMLLTTLSFLSNLGRHTFSLIVSIRYILVDENDLVRTFYYTNKRV